MNTHKYSLNAFTVQDSDLEFKEFKELTHLHSSCRMLTHNWNQLIQLQVNWMS